MVRNKQSGFAALTGLLGIVIFGLIIGTGWYVWNSQQETNTALEASNSAAQSYTKPVTKKQGHANGNCSIGVDMQGKLLSIGDGVFSFCQPNGWKLLHTEVPSAFFAHQTGIIYQENVAPTTEMTGGSDNTYEFGVYTRDDIKGLTTGFTKKSSSKIAGGLDVDSYYHLTGLKDPVGGGIGYLPEGTEQYKYIVTKNEHKLVFSYLHMMEADGLSADVEAVAATTR